ncbi:hypothetical protein FACS189481_4320 [Clostridia bacterium]|nr:hypothetical protein FACS189481_4320 [Clostridia bacterium]
MKKAIPNSELDEKDEKSVKATTKATTKKTPLKPKAASKPTKEIKTTLAKKVSTKETTTKKEAPEKTTRKPTAKKDTPQTKEVKKELTYKGLPLARLGNDVYYGDPDERYIIKLTTLESEKWEDLDLATKVSVELISTSNHNVCKKKSEKDSLYHALDIGQIWLKRILNEEAS